ncbi:GumC family protein [Myxacorys almedinensis]|uniref:non-specific protein-tyrosine kinase n=1 Tax=Myxacorys almedinensis A TaxID=2690445 RepID=A0A8J7Z4B8_9CYAN|nr:polysaccharide biosynthesis tyrosine autokinase [Myxacorys almedinensis]NDJ16213.1 polysaccharide biosynthesis tyrosine autokinase [Myxacorys almedinensis A]
MNTNPLSKSSLYPSDLSPNFDQGAPVHFLSLNSTDNKSGIEFRKIWEVVRRRKLFVGTVASLIFAATMTWSVSRKPIYLSTFRLLVEPNRTSVQDPQQAMLPNVAGSSVNYTTLTQVLSSSQILYPLYQSLQAEYQSLTFEQFLKGLAISRVKDTEILDISYLDQDSTQGLVVAEKLAEHYLKYSEQLRSRDLQQGVTFVEKQLPGLTNRVNQIQGKLEDFRKQHGIVNPEDRAKYLTEMSGQIEAEQKGVQAKLAESKALYATLSQQVRHTPEQAIAASALSESKTFQGLRDQLQQLETQVSINAERLTPESPPLQALLKKREGLLAQMQLEAQRTLKPTGMEKAQSNLSGSLIDLNRQLITVSNEIRALEAKNQSLLATAEQLQSSFASIPALVRQNVDFQRELKVANDSLDRFLASQENLQIQAAQKNQPWQVISAPSQRAAPVFPNVPQSMGLGFLGSLFLSVLAALLVEKLDDVLYSAEDLKQGVKFPVLSVIPFYRNVAELSLPAIASLRNLPASPSESELDQPQEVTPSARPFAIDLNEDAAIFREAFRSLYLNVSVLNLTNAIHSVVITSPLASDGKSTIALNTALAAAIMGQRVLIVDADLYRSKTHIYARVPNEDGLSQCLTSDVPAHRLIQQSPLDQNLFVLTAGKPQMDASRLLSSAKMKQMMEALKGDYDLIIYDAPPVLGFSDSAILSSHTDGSVVVVGLGNTGRTALVESLRNLQLSGNTVLGVVANCLKPGTHLAHDYHKYVRRNYNTELTGSASI